MNAGEIPVEPGEIITFYSYKGGTGRSMVLANTACLLAQREEGYGGVLVVDWDLEAPGLHRYFADRLHRQFPNRETASAELDAHPGLIDFFIRLKDEIEKLPRIGEEPTPEIQEQLKRALDLNSFVLSTDVPNLWMIKAGAFDDQYATRVNTFPWEPLYKRAPWVIALVADWLTERFRYTLIDSRTGITDTSGICTMLLPDKLAMVFTPNQQSLDGALQVTERSTNYRRRSSDLRPLSVFPVPSRIEASEPELRNTWRKGATLGYQPKFEALFKKVWSLDTCNLDPYFNEVQIQHSSAYAFGEKVAVLLEKGDDRTSLRRAYTAFVERLALDEPWDSPAPATPDSALTRIVELAESVYAQLRPPEQEAARRLFLQLVRVPADSPKPVSRERKYKVLPADAQAISQGFVDRKVLSLRQNTDGEIFISLADENLSIGWRRMVEWIASDHEFLRWRDSLDAAMSNWDQFGRQDESLLRASPLVEAEKRLRDRLDDLNYTEREFIQSSLALKRRNRTLVRVVGAAGLCLLALVGWVGLHFQNKSLESQAQAILDQGGPIAAIRTERVFAKSDSIDSRVRTLLSHLPQPTAIIPSLGTFTQLLFSPDASYLAVAYADGKVRCFHLPSAEPVFTVQLATVFSMAFSPDGVWLATGDNDGIRTRTLQSGRQTSFHLPRGNVTTIAFNPASSFFLNLTRVISTSIPTSLLDLPKWVRCPGTASGRRNTGVKPGHCSVMLTGGPLIHALLS